MKRAILFVRRECGYTFDVVRTTGAPPARGDVGRAWNRWPVRLWKVSSNDQHRDEAEAAREALSVPVLWEGVSEAGSTSRVPKLPGGESEEEDDAIR